MDDSSSDPGSPDSPVPAAVDPLCEGAVEAGLFESREALVRTALRLYFDANPDERVTAAVAAYEAGGLMLGEAATLAGTDRFSFEETLADRGVERRTGPQDETSAVRDAETAKGLVDTDDTEDP